MRIKDIFVTMFLLCLIVQTSTSQEGPKDPFFGVLPSFNTSAPEPIKYKLGDWGVAEQRGAATYTFPIAVPPGRNGMAPSLVLRYSSHSPIRGGVAAGWTLDIPSVRIDLPLGRKDDPIYKASLGGISGRLVKVPDRSVYGGETYRIENDETFIRFEYFHVGNGDPEFHEHSSGWLAMTTDGIRHYFEESIFSSDFRTRWQITRQVDPFGNTIRYIWERPEAIGRKESTDFAIRRIEYTSNESAGLDAHAKVEFKYSPLDFCEGSSVPIGAAYTYYGKPYFEGARRLIEITTSVKDKPDSEWRIVRRVSLRYDMEALRCDHNASPLRYLMRIDVKGYDQEGKEIASPPVTFEYNRNETDFYGQNINSKFGFSCNGSTEGTLGTLLDIDSDAILDRVSVEVDENGICTLVWQKGRFGGSFDKEEQRWPLPTASWFNGTNPSRPTERCTLNGQVTFRRENDSIVKGYISYHFRDYNADGKIDLLTNIWSNGKHEQFNPMPKIAMMIKDPTNIALAMRDMDALFPGVVPPEFGPSNLFLKPEIERRRYVWRIYLNTGVGFKIEPMKVLSPLYHNKNFLPSLPPTANEEILDKSVLPNISIPLFADLNGDGYLDFIDRASHPNLLGYNVPLHNKKLWYVHFGPLSFNEDKRIWEFRDGPYEWTVPNVTLSLEGRIENPNDQEKHLKNTIVAGLYDMNGDMLLDLVLQTRAGVLKAFMNNGSGFSTWPINLGLNTPLEEIQTDYIPPLSGAGGIQDGSRAYRSRIIDINNDGLPDRLEFLGDDEDVTKTDTVKVYFNVGDRFLPERELPIAWAKAKRLFRAENGTWKLYTDYVDGNGDGLNDLVMWSESSDPSDTADSEDFMALSEIIGELEVTLGKEKPLSAPRALAVAENGRGLRIDIAYAPSTDPRAVSWPDVSQSIYLPSPVWVVTALKVVGGYSTPAMMKRYEYADPVFQPLRKHADIPDPNRFLGFKSVIISTEATNSGSCLKRIEREYAYHDPNGRITNERTYIGEGGDFLLHKHKEITWSRRPLFSSQVFFTHRNLTLTRTYAPGADETENVHRVKETWTPVPVPAESILDNLVILDPDISSGSSQPAVLYVQSIIQEGRGLAEGEKDRRTTSRFQIRYGQTYFRPDDYRVLPYQTITEEAQITDIGLRFKKIGQIKIHYDRDKGLPIKKYRWMNQSIVAITKRTYDPQTGNLLTVTKPEQAAPGGSGKCISYIYDPHKLFVQTEFNELGHKMTTAYDVATGAKLERKGPNYVMKNGISIKERETWKIDGFGRVLEHAISIDDETEGYALNTIRKKIYLDFESPNRLQEQQLIEFGIDRWVTTDRIFDGLGRLLAKTILLDKEQYDAVTKYEYDEAGNLSAIWVPDPSEDGNNVIYTYKYDGLGRLKKFTRPDDTGLSIVYSGLEETYNEITTDGSGSTTKLVYDVFGRLIEVHEFDPESSTAFTFYEYDTDGNLTRVTDADGNISYLRYDWAGNRIKIQRGVRRIWQYHYDRNGNLIAKIDPVPLNADSKNFTTTYEYDDLDRIVIKKPAPRDMPPERRAQLGIGPTGYAYDDGPNGIGRLSGIRLPFFKVMYDYNAQGLVSLEQRLFKVDYPLTASSIQSVKRQYNALGQPTLTVWEDGQKWLSTYDERGFVDKVEWFNPKEKEWKKVAVYERSIAGQPQERITSFGQSRKYTYDVLGRPRYDIILKKGDPITESILTRTYYYSDSHDLISVSGITAGISASTSYTYDARHQLKTATGPNGYSGLFTYSLAGNVKTASVTWNNSPHTRAVNYEYGATDPQAVDRLINKNDGNVYGYFKYDLSGNMVERTFQGYTWTFEWDGDNQLREARGPNGSEVYYYDHNGQRILAASRDDGVRFWFDESETQYNVTGSQIRRYLHLSDGGSTLARVEGGSEIELQYADALKNLMLSLDKEGNVTASFLYGPFGEVVQSNGEDNHKRQFNSKENDIKTGLMYYGYRYYDPLILRWNSADPLYRFAPDLRLTEPARQNLFMFSLNNPLRYFDPDGRDPTMRPTKEQKMEIQAYMRMATLPYINMYAGQKAVDQAVKYYGIKLRSPRARPEYKGPNKQNPKQLGGLKTEIKRNPPQFNIRISVFEKTMDFTPGDLAAVICHENKHIELEFEGIKTGKQLSKAEKEALVLEHIINLYLDEKLDLSDEYVLNIIIKYDELKKTENEKKDIKKQ